MPAGWTEADEVIAFAELYLEPVPRPLPAWQRQLIKAFFAEDDPPERLAD